jgi:aminopeptidase N
VALPNLTREQAFERAAMVTVESYRIDLDLTDGSGGSGEHVFRSVTTVEFAARSGAETFIDIAADTIRVATLNGVEIDVSGYDESAGIPLRGLAEHNVVVVDADCRYSTTGEGLHRFVDPVDSEVYLYSQFETADAKRVFACFDQPDLKATFDITVTVPLHWAVVSNGVVVEVRGGTHTFATTARISTYIVAVVAGPYVAWRDTYTDEHGEIPLGLFCRKSLAAFMDDERLFRETKQGFGFYHSNFGVPYPFGKYDQLFVPEYDGAMENAAAVTFSEEFLFRSRVTAFAYEERASVLLHEMAHMWFGDLVTMRWWDDLWLNESFATFAAALCQAQATDYTQAWTTFTATEKAWAYRQDQLPSTHPVAADIPDLAAVEVNFDGITYAKGASVLRQLVAYVGLDEFLAGLRGYFREHAFGSATFGDLLGALEKASGRNLSHWGRQWLASTGINTLSAEFAVDADGRFSQFSIRQVGAAPGAGETRAHRLAVGIYDDDGSGKLVRTDRAELDVDGEVTDVPALQGVSRGRLVLLNDDDLTYCSHRLDPESLQTVRTRITDVADPLPRALIWSATRQMTRDAEMRARDFVTLVTEAIHAETDIAVVQELLACTVGTLADYADPAWARTVGWPLFADRLLELAESAAAGSDHQLAFVEALCGAVLSRHHVSVLAGLLDCEPAEVGLTGLQVDTDLRWRILSALAGAGQIDPEPLQTPVIDAELRRDPTSAGRLSAMRAMAARPRREVKEQAWRRVTEDRDLTHAERDAILSAFRIPGQEELLRRFTQRYFDEAAEIWERWPGGVGRSIIASLYPSWDKSTDALNAADEFLARDVPPALRRLVTEGRADTERALNARDFDAR